LEESRRDGEEIIMRKFLLWLFAVSLTVLGGSCARKTPTLSLLVWEGYADPLFVKAFEEQNQLQGFGLLHGIER
jgi:spermidine/putrescine-binding protein